MAIGDMELKGPSFESFSPKQQIFTIATRNRKSFTEGYVGDRFVLMLYGVVEAEEKVLEWLELQRNSEYYT